MAHVTDSTVMRIAGNIAAGLVTIPDPRCSPITTASELREWAQSVAVLSVVIARGIVTEVQRTRPAEQELTPTPEGSAP